MKITKINPAATRKLKYGAIAIVLTAVVVAAVIIFNAIFSSLVYKYNWYVDMTKEGLYGLSDAGRAMLDDIDAPINIIFCEPYDQLEANSYTKMILSLVKEMAAAYDNITYTYVDIISNPTAVTKYKTTTATSIKTTDVIIESGTEFRVFKATALFVQNESQKVWAFNGELKLISAMIQITQAETPIAYYTHTHGESVTTEMYQMLTLLADAGFDVQPIDLTKEDFSKDGRLLVIYNPLYDFEGISEDTKGRKSEIEKIDDFLDGFGNLMVFIDPDTQELPELDEFLSEWGISFDKSVLKDPTSSLDTEHYSLVGEYSIAKSTASDTTSSSLYSTSTSTEQTYDKDALGASLVNSMTSLGTPPKTVVKYARPINLLWDSKDGRITSTVLYTSDNAEKYVDGKKVETGKYPLVVLSRESRYIDNTPHYSYIFACGSQYLTSSDYLGRKAYGNSDIVYAMMRTMGKTQVPVDLDFKVFDDESLDITTAEATNWTVFLSAIIPACFLLAGLVVWIRRKHA